MAGVRAGLGRFTSDLGWVQTSPGPAQTGPFDLRPSVGGEPLVRYTGRREIKKTSGSTQTTATYDPYTL